MIRQVAKDVVAYCTHCRMDLVHVIVAIDGDKIAKVLCKTCNREHAYRTPRGAATPSTMKKKKKSVAGGESKTPFAEWELALEQSKDLPAKIYSRDGSFEAGDKVDHNTFGLGLVKRLISPKKMEVLFKEGTKLMVRGD